MTVYVNAKIIENKKIISDDAFVVMNEKIYTGKVHNLIHTSPYCSDVRIVNLSGKTIVI